MKFNVISSPVINHGVLGKLDKGKLFRNYCSEILVKSHFIVVIYIERYWRTAMYRDVCKGGEWLKWVKVDWKGAYNNMMNGGRDCDGGDGCGKFVQILGSMEIYCHG